MPAHPLSLTPDVRESIRRTISLRPQAWGLRLTEDRDRLAALIAEYRPTTCVEVGTFEGTSAVWLAERVPKLITIDTSIRSAVEMPGNTRYIVGAPNDPTVVRQVREQIIDPVLVVLSPAPKAPMVDHLRIYAPMADWLVVEGILWGLLPGVAPDEHDYRRDQGPAGALAEWDRAGFEEMVRLTNQYRVTGSAWLRSAGS